MDLDTSVFAHSTPDGSAKDRELLADHLDAVGRRAALFAEPFGWAQAAGVAGRLHDIGKGSAAFQAYIRQPRDEGGRTRGPDHSTAGARVAFETYGRVLGRLLAFTIAGHHAGPADFSDLERRLDPSHRLPFQSRPSKTLRQIKAESSNHITIPQGKLFLMGGELGAHPRQRESRCAGALHHGDRHLSGLQKSPPEALRQVRLSKPRDLSVDWRKSQLAALTRGRQCVAL